MEKILIVPDTHVPFHDERALRLVLKVGRAFEPDVIVHQGDLADFYSVSAHSKSPDRMTSLKDEVDEVRRVRARFDKLGAERKVFIEGNHEYRLTRYLCDKAPELYGLVGTDELLRLTENGWEYTPYKQYAKIGKVYFTHDTGNSGKYTTARALDAFQHSVAIGHHHQIEYRVEGDAIGKYRVGAQFGWLGDASQADYMHQIKAKRNWSLGFGIGYRDRKTGVVFLVPCPIVHYTTCVEGKLYRG